MFRENTKPDLVESGSFQRFQRLPDPLIRLQFPHITGCSYRIVRHSVLICKMPCTCHTNWSVIALRRLCHMKFSTFFCTEAAGDLKFIITLKRWHKTYLISPFPVIKSINFFYLIFSRDRSFYCLFCKWISFGWSWNTYFPESPLLCCFLVVNLLHCSYPPFRNKIL